MTVLSMFLKKIIRHSSFDDGRDDGSDDDRLPVSGVLDDYVGEYRLSIKDFGELRIS